MIEHFQEIEKVPFDEIHRRHTLCREICQKNHPQSSGLLFFSRLAIYYLSGTLADGIFWLPIDGEPLLLLRRGKERAKLESPLKKIQTLDLNFSWKDLEGICFKYESPLNSIFCVEMSTIPWNMANDFRNALKGYEFLSADDILLQARSRKSEWELVKMRKSGELHNKAQCEILPKLIYADLSEKEISHIAWDVFLSLGHSGINRLGNFGEESFLGHIAVGQNGNYPSHFNGPLGLKGEHPSSPYMGHAQSIWKKNQILITDIGFVYEGYHTDKTHMYFSGKVHKMPLEARKAYDACVEIQQRSAEQLKVGAIPSEIWADAKATAEKLGFADGFMGIGANKVPFLGHGIGLVIDEFPVLANRFDSPLVEGMTMAIEPKVGIAGVGMVGIENTFEITKNGGVSISGNDFRIIEVE